MVKAHPIGSGVVLFFQEFGNIMGIWRWAGFQPGVYALVRYLVAVHITGLGIIF
jgi:hypothetical protein